MSDELAEMQRQYRHAALETHMLVEGVLHLRCHRCKERPIPRDHWAVLLCDPCLDEAQTPVNQTAKEGRMTASATRIWFERNTGSRIHLRPVSGGGTGWNVKLSSPALSPLDDCLRESYHSDTLLALQEVAARMDKVPGDWVTVP